MSRNIFHVIDIGSNTVCGQVLEISLERKVYALEHQTYVLKLGCYLLDDKLVPEHAVEQLVQSLHKLVQVSQSHETCHTYLIGTSVLREASNATEILARIKHELGYDVDVLSTEDEGLLAYKSALSVFPDLSEHLLVCDLGGGSCEMIYSHRNQLIQNDSWPYGLAKMKQLFQMGERLSVQEGGMVRIHCQTLCAGFLDDAPWSVENLVVTSSALKVAALMLHPNLSYEQLDQVTLHLDDLCQLEEMCYFEKDMKYLDDDKRDLVCLGLIFFQELCQAMQIEVIHICPGSIREAYALRRSSSILTV